jgi:hypothetical protein
MQSMSASLLLNGRHRESRPSSLGGSTGDAERRSKRDYAELRGAAFRQCVPPRGHGHARSGHDSRGGSRQETAGDLLQRLHGSRPISALDCVR